MDQALLHFSGLQEETGAYAVPPSTPRESLLHLSEPPAREEIETLQILISRGPRGLLHGDPRDLAQAGWGVVFAQKNDQEAQQIREALKPLLELRRQQATCTGKHHRYREYRGKRGYREGDSKKAFLAQNGVAAGEVNPDEMPYYLLVVGDPRDIPYEVQCLLDVERAVGRLHFDTVEEYARYARRVVAAESASAVRERRADFFAPRHADDDITPLFVDHLVKPVAAHAARHGEGWKVRRFLEKKASKKQLARLLGGADTPDFLFTAGHGMVLHQENPCLLQKQGALVCSEWPGHSWKERISPDFYFSGDDFESAAGSLIAFFFSCFSGGAVPRRSYDLEEKVVTAPHPFVANLPRALLGRFEAGALAVIAHVDLAFVYSFHAPGRRAPLKRLAEFKLVVEQILQGYPVGAAMEIFGRRYAALAADLSEELLSLHRGKVPDQETDYRLWLCQDARNYIILGDPAVRLAPPETRP